MQQILLYAPDVIGHPRVYCRVLADLLSGSDCQLAVAMGFGEKAELADCADLLPLTSRHDVRMLDTREFSELGKAHLRAEEICQLQSALKIDTTLFIEADKSAAEFRRIAKGNAPRLLGRNLGIFANTAEWHPGENSFTGERHSILALTLIATLGNLKRALFERRKSPKYFYEQLVLGEKVLDEILVKDERLASWFGPPVYWMPEISRPLSSKETAAEAEDFLRRQAELKAFLASNPGREPLLYFGDAAFYKGYDLFLQFVSQSPSTCAIHAGQTYDAQQRGFFQHDVDALRKRLKHEGRLLETNEYVHTQRLKALYFGAIRLYVTTHRLALSSSTVIQALEMGKPVLVPDRGVLGHRVRTHGLGGVYAYEDLEDLGRKAELLWRSDLARYAEPALSYWQRFSDESIRKFFVQRLLAQH